MTTRRDRMLNELQSITAELGRAPMPDELAERGAYTIEDYRDELRSWANALDTADIAQPIGIRIPDDTLLAEIQRLANELNKTPSEQEMSDQGYHSIETYKKRFGAWNEAVEAAGLDPNPDRKERPRESLLADLQEAATDLGRPPSRREIPEYTEFDPITFRNHFGSWNQALEAAGLESRSPQERVSDDELLTELRALADELGEPPTTTDMQKEGTFSPSLYYKRFDTWSAALEAAGV